MKETIIICTIILSIATIFSGGNTNSIYSKLFDINNNLIELNKKIEYLCETIKNKKGK